MLQTYHPLQTAGPRPSLKLALSPCLVFAPCPRGWRIPYDMTVDIAKLAVTTAFWPLFEVIDGEWIYSKRSVTRESRKPIEEGDGVTRSAALVLVRAALESLRRCLVNIHCQLAGRLRPRRRRRRDGGAAGRTRPSIP